MLATSASLFLASCDYFSLESQLLKQVNGIYGATSNCVYVGRGEEPPVGKEKPILTVIGEYYGVDDRYCALDEIIKDDKGFILKSEYCTGNYKKLSESGMSSESITPFELRVEEVKKNIVTIKETGTEPVTVYRCGSDIN